MKTNDHLWAGSLLLHPITWVALTVWIANDHLLKTVWPSVLTGKLSDVAGLIVCPLLVLRSIEMVRPSCFLSAHARRFAMYVVLTVIGLFLIGIKTNPAAALVYQWGLGAAQWPLRSALALLRGMPCPELLPVRLVRDHSDLWTLPSLLVPLWLAHAESGSSHRRQAINAALR